MTAREVELTGGAPWGFRMHGGIDQNQPLRISRVNPGRKASLSGIREGDVISSINGRPTRTMSNAEAQAMLRNAGPVLKLGLNEDKQMSPRRRSIGKGNTELKRPSQLITDLHSGRTTPQAPVYATIRPSQSPNRTASSPLKPLLLEPSSSVLTSTNLVKTVTSEPAEMPLRFHPTNPFYSTLPSHYNTSASRLPIPNGKTTYSSLDRSITGIKPKEYTDSSDLVLKDSGFDSLPQKYLQNQSQAHSNGYTTNFDDAERQHFFNESKHVNGIDFPKTENEFSTKSNIFNTIINEPSNPNDPFDKYLRNVDESYKESRNIPISQSDSNFHSTNNEEMTKRSIITEHKVDQIEKVKTIKKIVLNGSNKISDGGEEHEKNTSSIYTDPVKINKTPPVIHNIASQNSPEYRAPNTSPTVLQNSFNKRK